LSYLLPFGSYSLYWSMSEVAAPCGEHVRIGRDLSRHDHIFIMIVPTLQHKSCSLCIALVLRACVAGHLTPQPQMATGRARSGCTLVRAAARTRIGAAGVRQLPALEPGGRRAQRAHLRRLCSAWLHSVPHARMHRRCTLSPEQAMWFTSTLRRVRTATTSSLSEVASSFEQAMCICSALRRVHAAK